MATGSSSSGDGGGGDGGGSGGVGWGVGMMKDLQPVKRLTNVTGDMYNKARNIYLDVKAKFKGEEVISMDKAVSILCSELHFPEERATNFLHRFNRNKNGSGSADLLDQSKNETPSKFNDSKNDKLSAKDFNEFVKKISEIKQEIIPAFQKYDADHNGMISLQEATNILGRPPFNFPPVKVESLLKRFDKDHNGQLDIEEFAAFYAEARISHEEVSECFDRLDKDGNGVLSPDEVLNVIQDRMGADRQTAENLIKLYDRNQDGNLDKTEFMFLWSAMFGQ